MPGFTRLGFPNVIKLFSEADVTHHLLRVENQLRLKKTALLIQLLRRLVIHYSFISKQGQQFFIHVIVVKDSTKLHAEFSFGVVINQWRRKETFVTTLLTAGYIYLTLKEALPKIWVRRSID
jgi:hypothetical protein